MTPTSISLLERLHDDHSGAWNQWQAIYAPMLRAWMRRYDVQDADADDLIQEVMLAVAKEVGTFDHNGRYGAFRSWLKRILVHRLRDFWRARQRRAVATGDSDVFQRLKQLEDPASELSQLWDHEHDRYVLGKLLVLAEPNFAPETWRAFRRVVIDRVSAVEVATECGMTPNAVFVAKSRVLSRLRQEAAGLVESSSTFLPKC